MKSVRDMTNAQIREAAHAAILKELGVLGLIRFIQDQSLGSGDYTRDRQNWLPKYESTAELFDDVRKRAAEMRKRGELPPLKSKQTPKRKPATARTATRKSAK